MNNKYTEEMLLDILASYATLIKRSGEHFPGVVLSDINASIKSILRKCNYNGRYKNFLEE